MPKPLKLVVVPMLLAAVVVLAAAPTAAAKIRGDAKIDMQMGVDAARRGYWQEALTRFQAANEKVPDKIKVLNNLAVAYEAVGRYDEALAVYERAAQMAPGDRNLSRNLVLFREFYNSYVRPPIKPDKEGGADAAEQPDEQDQGKDESAPAEEDPPPPAQEDPSESGSGS